MGPFGGCGSSKVEETAESESFDAAGYKLTDEDVEKLIRDLPELSEDLKKLGFTVEHTPTDIGKYFAAQAGAKALLAKLRAKGWNPPEKFFAVLSRTAQAYLALKLTSAMETQRAQMERMLKDPNVPEAVKGQIRKELKQVEGMQGEMDEDVKVVKRHLNELEKVFKSLK